jgi:tetratricopeptide (TPR) repeat protein
MSNKQLKQIFGLLAFVIATTVYLLTVQDSVPFWDCSEFSGAAIWQQVPHPPGAPLFLMIGKMFDVLIPFGDPGWKINLVSVFSSSFTVFLLYLITTYVIKNLKGGEPKNTAEAFAVYGGAFVGALAFTFSDTFWFNAVESEVYAMATLFVAIVVYLMMLWNDRADEVGSEKYLMLIAYIIGLSTGVHLLAILAIFSIVYLVYFRKYTYSHLGLIYTSVIALVLFATIYPGVVKWIPALLAGHTPDRNAAREYMISDSTGLTFVTIMFIVGVVALFVYGYKKNNQIIKLVSSSFLLILLGYTTYTQILIRSNSNPPMNENEPKTFTSLASYLGREQYGSLESWPRRAQNEDRFIQEYRRKTANGEYYYGPWEEPDREEVRTSDGRGFYKEVFNDINIFKKPEIFWGEVKYLWKYQIDHMYLRYFLWNFSGRTSDVQDASAFVLSANKQELERDNFNNGYAHIFPINFFAIPLLIGLLGLYFHFSKDKKMAFIYLLMFLMMGVLAAIAQQQQNPQPRERDYFYTGSFMIFSMWIGIGVYALIEMASNKNFKSAVSLGIIAISTVLVPVNMAYGGWELHDRTGNYAPFDYSYNILQSAEENAIIFTNGDNDTFPVWYIQDVMGVRRDVRIVNLSLGNTLWYVDQLKNRRPWGAEKIPLSFSDESLQVKDEMDENALTYERAKTRTLNIPVNRKILAKYTTDNEIVENGMFTAEVTGRAYGEGYYLYRVQDKLIFDILEQTKFERPIYFSTTVGPDAFAGLEPFFRHEGMLMRICPAPQFGSDRSPAVDIDIMMESLMNVDNTENYSKTPKYGFKIRNYSNLDVYYDEVHRRLSSTYRELYLMLAKAIIQEDRGNQLAIDVLNKMGEMISNEQFPMPYYTSYEISEIYKNLGNTEKADEYRNIAIKDLNTIINNDNIEVRIKTMEATQRVLGPHRLAAMIHADAKDYLSAKEVMKKFISYMKSYEMALRGDAQASQMLQASIIDSELQLVEYEIDALVAKDKFKEAMDLINNEIEKYSASGEEGLIRYVGGRLYQKTSEINQKMGIRDKEIGDSISEN